MLLEAKNYLTSKLMLVFQNLSKEQYFGSNG